MPAPLNEIELSYPLVISMFSIHLYMRMLKHLQTLFRKLCLRKIQYEIQLLTIELLRVSRLLELVPSV